MSAFELALHKPKDLSDEIGSADERGVDFEKALVGLDQLSDHINISDIVNIVGVEVDIKPSTIVAYKPDLLDAIDDLGLATCLFGYDPDDIDKITVSKNQELAYELAYLFRDKTDLEEDHRRIGELLGYPKTATDYYLERRLTLDRAFDERLPIIKPAGVKSVFCQFNLSPERWRDEVDEYAAPLESAARGLIPVTFLKIEELARKNERARRRKIARGAIRVVYATRSSDEYFEEYGAKVRYVS